MPPTTGTLGPSGDGSIEVDRASLSRFADTAPQLRRLLESSDGCDRELLLQAAMRDTLREISQVSGRAARMEADPLRADQLRVLSRIAMELARTPSQ